MHSWLSYAADMSDSEIYGELTDNYKDRTLKNADGKPVGIPYAVESYGIIYNKSLLKKYFDASWSSVKSIDKLNNFKALKTVADEIQEHKDDLGVKGAFTSAGMDTSSAFRYNFHLPSVPLFYEYRDDGVDMNSVPESVKGTYVDYMKNIFDLYLTDSTTPASAISGKTMDDSTSEFAMGEAVFFQDGVWIYSNLQDQGFPDEDLGVLPIYMGVDGDEDQGLNQVSPTTGASTPSPPRRTRRPRRSSWSGSSPPTPPAIPSRRTWAWSRPSRPSTTRRTRSATRWSRPTASTRMPASTM